MGKIIKFNKECDADNITQPNAKKQKHRIIGVIWSIIVGTGVVFGLYGTSIKDLRNTYFSPDWQAIAEKYNNEGLQLYNLGEYEDAIAMYDKAIELEEKDIENIDVCYFNRGMAYYKLGDYEKAVGDYTIAINDNPRSKYYLQRALAYNMLGDSANEALDNLKAITGALEQ